MAGRKKQEISLQAEVNAQEEWEDVLQKEGLLVVDVYQDWCGPCKAMSGLFRRVKNETSDDLLNFAVAKADSIDSLERYRGSCEPCFLIYGGGALVGVCRGANPPILEKLIKQKLSEEHKCITGEMERLEIRDPFFAKMDEEEKRLLEEMAEREDEIEMEVTVALIKPDAVKNGKVDEILDELCKRGIHVLAHEQRRLTDEEARQFYAHMNGESYFENMVKYLTSDISHILVLGGDDDGIISEFRDLIGPPNADEAKEKAPESLRALYGTSTYQNAIHGADSKESVARELAFFFPDFQIPKTKKKKVKEEGKPQIERTLAIVRPDAYAEFKDSILQKIHEAGFTVAMQREKQLTRLEVEEFYSSHKGQPYYNDLVEGMVKGPSLILALARQDAVNTWRRMLGPKDPKRAKEETPEALRSQFQKDDVRINLLHGSSDKEGAEKELHYFFPVEETVAVIKPDAYENKEEILERIKEAGFQIEAIKETHLTVHLARELYKDIANREYYDELVNHMSSGTSTLLLLSREDAVQGFRTLMGDPSPEVAAEKNVETLRAIYGKTIKENAIHASSSIDQAKRTHALLFGEGGHNEDVQLPAKSQKPSKEEKAEEEISHESQKPSKEEKAEEEMAHDTHVAKDETHHGDTHVAEDETHHGDTHVAEDETHHGDTHVAEDETHHGEAERAETPHENVDSDNAQLHHEDVEETTVKEEEATTPEDIPPPTTHEEIKEDEAPIASAEEQAAEVHDEPHEDTEKAASRPASGKSATAMNEDEQREEEQVPQTDDKPEEEAAT